MNNKIKIEVLISSPTLKVLKLNGNVGDTLDKHQVNQEAVLIVNQGSLVYSEETRQQQLVKGNCMLIPADTLHAVECTELTNFFIVLPSQTKMKFEK